jgi:hypothetical protein
MRTRQEILKDESLNPHQRALEMEKLPPESPPVPEFTEFHRASFRGLAAEISKFRDALVECDTSKPKLEAALERSRREPVELLATCDLDSDSAILKILIAETRQKVLVNRLRDAPETRLALVNGLIPVMQRLDSLFYSISAPGTPPTSFYNLANSPVVKSNVALEAIKAKLAQQ